MLRLLLFFFKWLVRLIIYLIVAVLLVIIIEYLVCPIYIFPDPEPFHGEYIFNPYQDIDSTKWRKSNFQVQSRAWIGITDGRKNSNEVIDSIYRFLLYDVITISDYQKINKYGNKNNTYIPVYEHGYGIFKNHQVLIGAKKILWTDYPLFQNIHHKQHILNLLGRTSDLIYIAHPKLRGAYSVNDMKYLSNYTGVEVLNYMRLSVEHWDAALSAGRCVTILGNDDAHDVFNPDEVGYRCTFINSSSLNGDSVINALRKGRAYGADIYRPVGEPFQKKLKKAKNIAKVKQVNMSGDTLCVEVDQKAGIFRFIGQDGKVKHVVENTKYAWYKISPGDTYIRTEIEFPNKTVFYLNPVIRYDGKDPWKMAEPEVDVLRTWLLRIIGFATLIFIILNICFIRQRIIKRHTVR